MKAALPPPEAHAKAYQAISFPAPSSPDPTHSFPVQTQRRHSLSPSNAELELKLERQLELEMAAILQLLPLLVFVTRMASRKVRFPVRCEGGKAGVLQHPKRVSVYWARYNAPIAMSCFLAEHQQLLFGMLTRRRRSGSACPSKRSRSLRRVHDRRSWTAKVVLSHSLLSSNEVLTVSYRKWGKRGQSSSSERVESSVQDSSRQHHYRSLTSN